MKIGVIHAAGSAVEPLEKVFHSMDPSIEVDNHLNEDMLKEAEQNGVTVKALRMFAKEVFDAADNHADGIIVACSVFCTCIDIVKPFLDIPVIAVDDAALHLAAQDGNRIGILATTPASSPACIRKLKKIADEQHISLSFEEAVCPQALSALKAGRADEHDALLAAEAKRLADLGCNVLFLSQVSMARVKDAMPEDLKRISLTTPEEGAREILRLIGHN